MSRLLKRQLIAAWHPINLDTSNTLQVLTDAMAYNSTVQINYRGSGWRSILPYGWNSSKDGNILLMCYKNTGEIRSYRVDKINDLLINDSLIESMPNDRPDDVTLTFNDFKIPTLPNLDKIIEETENEVKNEKPYDIGIKALTENEIPDDYNKSEEYKDGEETTTKNEQIENDNFDFDDFDNIDEENEDESANKENIENATDEDILKNDNENINDDINDQELPGEEDESEEEGEEE